MSAILLSLTLVVVTLSGCAASHKFSYAHARMNVDSIGSARSASVAVLDQRTYVMSGRKSDAFVGLSREGFAKPSDVETYSGTPMASEMGSAIAAALQAKWHPVQTITVRPGEGPEIARQALLQTGSDRALLFTFNEWKTNTLMRTQLHFDVTLDVLDSHGRSLAHNQVSGTETSGVSLLSPEQIVQKWFAAKITELLRDEAVVSMLH